MTSNPMTEWPDTREAPPSAGVWRFTFDGIVQPFVRHRAGDDSGRANRYRASKLEIGFALRRLWGEMQPIPPNVPIRVHLTVWRREIYKADVDNLAKTILDAATGVLWVDDRYVTEINATKATGRPGFEMVVTWPAE